MGYEGKTMKYYQFKKLRGLHPGVWKMWVREDNPMIEFYRKSPVFKLLKVLEWN